MKIRLILVFFMMFFTSYVCAAKDNLITMVNVKGLHNVKLGKVLSVISLEKGKSYSAQAAKKDIGAITELKCFDNIEVRYDKSKGMLTFVVTEKPYIDDIVFKGNLWFSKNKLRNVSLFKQKDYYDSSKLEEAKKKILDLYSDKGYIKCKVECYPTIDSVTNKMTITFLVTEGNKVVIGKINIKGNKFLKNKRFLKLMKKTKVNEVFKEESFKNDLDAVSSFYLNNGFMDYKFVSSSIAYDKTQTKMLLTLNIKEGSSYKIGKVTYSGNLSFDDEKIEKLIKLKSGCVFEQDKIIETIQAMYEFYKNEGYLNVFIDQNFSKNKIDKNVVNVNFSIKENYIVHVGNIDIDGLVYTDEKFIRREFSLKSGDVLALNKVRRGVEKIHNLGFVEGAVCRPIPTSETSDIMDLFLSVTESVGANVNLMLGASAFDINALSGGLQFQHLNLFGRGQRGTLSGELSKRNKGAELEWSEPWFLNKNLLLSGGASIEDARKDHASIEDAYSDQRISAYGKVGHRLTEYTALSLGFKVENIKIYGISKAAAEADVDVKESESTATSLKKLDSLTTSVFVEGSRDSRNDFFDPSKGNKTIFVSQIATTAFGGDISFIKGTAKSTWYFPTVWKFVLSINLEGMAIWPYANQEQIPIYERFTMRGNNTVRGYKETGEIGPDGGGTVKGILNVEYKCPLAAPDGKTFVQGFIFGDIGGIWNDFKSTNFEVGKKLENLHFSLGFGLKVATPIAPIKFEWGWGFNHIKPEDNKFLLGFSMALP
jgi:outer membrane protein insertion porin family